MHVDHFQQTTIVFLHICQYFNLLAIFFVFCSWISNFHIMVMKITFLCATDKYLYYRGTFMIGLEMVLKERKKMCFIKSSWKVGFCMQIEQMFVDRWQQPYVSKLVDTKCKWLRNGILVCGVWPVYVLGMKLCFSNHYKICHESFTSVFY